MKTDHTRKRGIALIVVLGLLALMMMMAVAFSIFMRTERHAAGSYQHDIRSQQMLFAAAARAQEALDKNLGTRFYPDWVALTSPGSDIILRTNQPWAAFVPDYVLAETNFPETAGWIDVPNGRVGYLIINASGLLDANRAGGSPRGSGVDPKEINLSGLSDVSAAATLVSKRDYESVSQMKKMIQAVPKQDIGLKSVSHFVTYSMSPTNVTPPPVNLKSGSLADVSGLREEIKTRLAGYFSDLVTDDVVDSLIDYVDPDSWPTRVNAPCMERVPMFNEIQVLPTLQRYRATDPPGQHKLELTPKIELFYPFVEPRGNQQYRIEASFSITAQTPYAGPAPGTVENNTTVNLDLKYGFLTPNLPRIDVLIDTNAYKNVKAQFKVIVNYLRLVETASSKTVDEIVNLDMTMGGEANRFPSITIPAPPAVFPFKGTSRGVECVDPRFNHLVARGVDWYGYSMLEQREGFPLFPENGSLGAMNVAATRWLNRTWARSSPNDGHPYMHVADKSIQSVGELSFLPRGGNQPIYFWNTLRLIKSGTNAFEKAEPLYEHFFLPPPTSAQRGFANPNTEVPDVLKTLFLDMPLDRFPGDAVAASEKVTAAQADRLVTAWLQDPNYPVGGYTNRSAVCANDTFLSKAEEIAGEMTVAYVDAHKRAIPFRKEAAIRNLLGLLNPRQNYFIIVLFAQSSTTVLLPGGSVPTDWWNKTQIHTVRADSTALMELWRDPTAVTAGGQSLHPMFVRRFEVLAEE